MKKRLPLLNALQLAQVDAVKLLVKEQEHHALCWRSISIVPHYGSLLAEVLRPMAETYSDEQKLGLATKLELFQVNELSAKKESDSNFGSVNRRTVIVLADIVENAVESTLAVCLMHLDTTGPTIKELTGFRREAQTEREYKTAVRRWESKLYTNHKQRTSRLTAMICAFFPDFMEPKDFGVLDSLFKARNRFTHEAIQVSDQDFAPPQREWSLAEVEQAFHVAGDFLIAIMKAIPGDLNSSITANPAAPKKTP